MDKVVALMLVLAVSGCSTAHPGAGSATADCDTQVRVDGVTYTSRGTTDRPGTPHGQAQAAECHDVGTDAHGSVFPDDPRQVDVWSFDGFSPGDVLGLRVRKDSFVVIVRDSIPEMVQDQISKELGHRKYVVDPVAPR